MPAVAPKVSNLSQVLTLLLALQQRQTLSEGCTVAITGAKTITTSFGNFTVSDTRTHQSDGNEKPIR
jgi:hypothetical protein